jgi:hypothetical protein
VIASRCALAALLLAASAPAASSQNPDSLRADSAFRRSDWPATVALYSRIAERTPTQGMAWMRIGMARHAMNELDPAIAAYERALALRFQPPTATYRLARVHALKGNIDRAFTYLDQLVPMRAIPVPILDTVSDLAAARRDPRYKLVVERMNALRFPCRNLAEARQLDFWIGDWDVTPWAAPAGPSAPLLGTNRIEPILEHCVLLENWAGGGPAPSSGKSINFWDTNRRQWRQVWVADGGGSLDYAGSFRDGAMRFEGWTLAPNGTRVLQKLMFFPIHRDTVRQLFETSNDSGKTWQPGFDGRYTRRRSP